MAQRHGLQLLHDVDGAVADIVFVHGLFGHPINTWTTASLESSATDSLSSIGSLPGEATGSETSLDLRKRSKWKIWSKRERGTSPQPPDQVSDTIGEGSDSEVPFASRYADRDRTSLFWPKDLLPKEFPESRIYSWGYDVDINHVFRSAGQSTVFQHAQMLLSDLADVRISEELRTRPIIFIAHSLGGVVVKDMLNASRNEVTYLKEILPATYGIIFLGTPHRGSEIATLGKMAQEITKIIGKRPNTAVLRDLEMNSEALDRVGRGFSQILVDYPLRIHSFREELPTKGIMIVNSFSSTLENGREIVSSIPASHENMTKFSSKTDIGFRRIAKVLERWKADILSESSRLMLESQPTVHVEGPKDESSHLQISADAGCSPVLSKDDKELLQTLCVSDYDEAKKGIAPRVSGTCSWFLRHPKYREWEQNDKSSLLWVSGEPGCGKSVLSAFLIEELKTISSRDARVFYFFCDKKLGNQINATEILCGLLHQIFSANHSLIRHARSQFESMGDQIVNRLQRLWNVFEEATSDPQAGHIICIIDALDECERSSGHDFIKFITGHFAKKSLSSITSSSLKVFLTSRPYISIERAFYGVSNVRLKAEDETESISADISLVIEERLNTVKELTDCTDQTKAKLKQRLLKNAGRTFLWVSLVLKLLESSVESSEAALLQTIDSLPEELCDVYEQILQNNPDQERAKYALSVIAAARRPFTLSELNIALAIREGDKSEHDLETRLAPKENMEKWIKRICGPFIRVAHSKITLVHLTAVEFLWKVRHDDNLAVNLSGFSRAPSSESLRGSSVSVTRSSYTLEGSYKSLWKNSLDPEDAHFLLSRICVWYLSFDIFEREPLVVSPGGKYADLGDNFAGAQVKDYLEVHSFLEYAAKYWGWHSWKSENQWEQTQLKPIFELCSTQSARFQTWFQVLWSSMSQKRAPQNVPMLSVASYFGHRRIIQRLIDEGADVNARDSDGYTALQWAVWHADRHIWEGHEAVKPLLDAGADIEARDNAGMTAIMWAAHNGQSALVRVLLERGAAINSKNDLGVAALHLASQSDGIEVITALLEKARGVTADNNRIEIDLTDKQNWTALHGAALKGHVEVARVLIKHGASIEARTDKEATPLYIAAFNGHESMVQLLLDSGADPRALGTAKWTTLHSASCNGHEPIVLLLLLTDKGPDVDATDAESWTALHLAAGGGYVGTVRILLEHGASIEARTNAEATPLYLAATNGHESLVQLLLDSGADARTLGTAKWTTLQCASNKGHDRIVLLLLQTDKRPDVDATDGEKWTALHLASTGGHVKAAQILLEHGANVEARTNKEATPLSIASLKGHKALVKLLLDNGADARALGISNWTTLHSASSKGHEQIVLLLLLLRDKGPDISATDGEKWTALHLAAGGGYINTVQILLEHGAGIEARTDKSATPLHLAILNRHEALVQFLLGKGANTKALGLSEVTTLQMASTKGLEKAVLMLLQPPLGNGADTKTTDMFNWTALHYAAENGHIGVARILLEHGASIEARTDKEMTPLHLAVLNGHEAFITFLLDNGANGRAIAPTSKLSALHMASSEGRHEVARLLLRLHFKGRDIDTKCAAGSTALHYAASMGREEVVRVLLEFGADTQAKNDVGATPLQLAAGQQHEKVIELLSRPPAVELARKHAFPTFRFLFVSSFLIVFLSLGIMFLFQSPSSVDAI